MDCISNNKVGLPVPYRQFDSFDKTFFNVVLYLK